MTIAIVTNWNDDGQSGFREIAELTIPNRQAYADRHGYAHHVFNFPGHYGKVSALLNCWRADWLWWLDLDAVITNPERRLDDVIEGARGNARPLCHAIATVDGNGFNSGSMLLRTSEEVRQMLQRIQSRKKTYDVPPWHDQNGFAYQLWSIADRVEIVAKNVLNSYPADWTPGDFVLHCPGIPNEHRRKILESALIRLGGLPVA